MRNVCFLNWILIVEWIYFLFFQKINIETNKMDTIQKLLPKGVIEHSYRTQSNYVFKRKDPQEFEPQVLTMNNLSRDFIIWLAAFGMFTWLYSWNDILVIKLCETNETVWETQICHSSSNARWNWSKVMAKSSKLLCIPFEKWSLNWRIISSSAKERESSNNWSDCVRI